MIYFVRVVETGELKIGYAVDPGKRLQELQTACPYPLELLGSIPGGVALEHLLQRHFAIYRIRGEWFRSDPVLLFEINQLLGDQGAVVGGARKERVKLIRTSKSLQNERAVRRLRQLLEGGPARATSVEDVLEAEGFSYSTIRRARERLGVQASKDSFRGVWWLQLPARGDEQPQSGTDGVSHGDQV